MTEKRFTIVNMGLDGRFIKEDGKIMTIERVVDLLNENEQLKSELKRCKEWLNSDKYDYQTTLAFIKSKGYSLKDVLEYEKEHKE